MDSAWEVANDTVALTTPRLRGVRRCVAKVATGANKSHQGLGCKPGPMFYSGCWYCDKMLCGIVVCTPCGHALHESCWLVSGRSSLGNAHCKVCGKQFSDVIRVHNMYPSGGTKKETPDDYSGSHLEEKYVASISELLTKRRRLAENCEKIDRSIQINAHTLQIDEKRLQDVEAAQSSLIASIEEKGTTEMKELGSLLNKYTVEKFAEEVQRTNLISKLWSVREKSNAVLRRIEEVDGVVRKVTENVNAEREKINQWKERERTYIEVLQQSKEAVKKLQSKVDASPCRENTRAATLDRDAITVQSMDRATTTSVRADRLCERPCGSGYAARKKMARQGVDPMTAMRANIAQEPLQKAKGGSVDPMDLKLGTRRKQNVRRQKQKQLDIASFFRR